MITSPSNLKLFGGKLPTGKKETGKFGKEIIEQNLVSYIMYLGTKHIYMRKGLFGSFG